MDFRLADTFTAALARLPAAEQKAVKVSVMDLQLDPSAPGLQMHRIDKSKDANFWSARVNRDIRLILHKTAASLLVAYVDHHDRAYAWAERRRIEAHPRTGAIQIVEVVERVEEAEPDFARLWTAPEPGAPVVVPPVRLFADLSQDELLSVGVPQDWLYPVAQATDQSFFEIAERLPAEAAEALLEYAAGGRLGPAADPTTVEAPEAPVEQAPTSDPYAHPDAKRRIRKVESAEELRAILDAPWDKWSVFLHPSQRAVVERTYRGPARVAGSAGTGKTVVALHRAARILRTEPEARLLLATFSEPLAGALRGKLSLLLGGDEALLRRASVFSFEGLALDLHELAFGRKARIVGPDQVAAALDAAAEAADLKGYSPRFLISEWASVIDAWRVEDAEAYAAVPRLGRRNRLGAKQRQALWPVFSAVRARLVGQGGGTWPAVFHALADHYGSQATKPFSHIVVDEAQDLGVPELRLLCALAPTEGTDRLFFAGDLGQRIFQQPFSWKALGADVRGRSTTLKVNYRTSQQIREAADRLLPAVVRDVDGREEDRRGTISIFEGPHPEIILPANEAAEIDEVAGFLRQAGSDGVAPEEMGVFVRSRAQLARARSAVEAAGFTPVELTEHQADLTGRVAVGTMHLAKGLEFKVVAVVACDDEVLPLAERIDSVVEESDLDDVYDTERHLLYVACTRARDRLLVSGVKPGSEFLADMG
ncbi:MAG: 3'-5' exonuclease [Phenylobacterium sp.]|nr:3'-5' exonuclease [Phenylobacterium sp.]